MFLTTLKVTVASALPEDALGENAGGVAMFSTPPKATVAIDMIQMHATKRQGLVSHSQFSFRNGMNIISSVAIILVRN